MPVSIASDAWRSCWTWARARFAGDPAAVVFRRGDFAIQRERGFQRDQRLAGPHEVEERLVELFGFGDGLASSMSTSIPAARSLRNPSPATSGIGILHSGDHAGNAGGDQRIGAGAGASLVRARLEGDDRAWRRGRASPACRSAMISA